MRLSTNKWLAIVALSVVYFLTAKLGLSLATVNPVVSAVWPPTGICIATLLLLGINLWPGVFLGAVAINWFVSGSPWVALGIGFGNTAEAVLGVWLMKSFCGGRDAFNTGNAVFRFFGLVAIFSTSVSATVGCASLFVGGFLTGGSLGNAWINWWLGNMVSALILTPLIVAWSAPARQKLSPLRWVEAAALVLLLLLVCLMVFGGWSAGAIRAFPLSSLVVPFLIWSAFRFGQRGAMLTSFLLASMAIAGTTRGLGPFARLSLNDSLLMLQMYMGTLTATMLVLAASLNERKNVESRLQDSERRFRQFAENIEEIFYVSNVRNPQVHYVSPAYEKIWGRSCESLYASPRSFLDAIHPEDRPGVLKLMDCLLEGQRASQEYRIIRPDGSVRWIHDRAFPLAEESGRRGVVTGIAEDITARKLIEEEHRQTEERYRVLFEKNPLPMWLTDVESHRFLAVNDAAIRHYGYSREEFMNGDGLFLFAHEDMATYRQLLANNDAPMQVRQWKHKRKDGAFIQVETTSHLISVNGQRARLVLANDITEQTRAAERMLQINAELEDRVQKRTAELEFLNKELEAFCYSVSHDLRAPLRAICGFSQAVLEDHAHQLDPLAQELLQRTCEGSHRMSQLIDDLLRLSRVSRSEMHREKVNLGALAKEVVQNFHELEPERKVTFSSDPRLVAKADPRLMRVVLENLLGNAWKFTNRKPDAHIELGLLHQNGASTFYIRDNGAGFDMEYAGKLFGVFQRLHSTSEFPGTGVGLATVQRIISRHGGRIWAEGQVDKGATFYFTLPNDAH